MILNFKSHKGVLHSVEKCRTVEEFFAKRLKGYPQFPKREEMYWTLVASIAPIKLGVFELPVEDQPTFFSDVFPQPWTKSYMCQVGTTISEWVIAVDSRMATRMSDFLPDGTYTFHGTPPPTQQQLTYEPPAHEGMEEAVKEATKKYAESHPLILKGKKVY